MAKKLDSEKTETTDNGDIIGLEEALAILKTTRTTLYRWIRQGRIPAMKAGRQWRLKRADIQKFLHGEKPVVALPLSPEPILKEVRGLIEQAGGVAPKSDPSKDPLEEAINLLLRLMVLRKASDIHVAPHKSKTEPVPVHLRIDGLMQKIMEFDPRLLSHLAERWRGLCRCEGVGPQTGRIASEIEDKEGEFRVCFLPTILGESIVARFLEPRHVRLSLGEDIKFSPENHERIIRNVTAPYGLVAFTGPAGSGKTTVLYAAVMECTKPENKILTVEDPVEYLLSGVNQIQVQPAAGLSFSGALKHVLRSDPDVIVIGELRDPDKDTLNMCAQAVLTGHLVLTSFHATNASNGLKRLIEMGADPYLYSEAVRLIVSQRLYRRLCPKCAKNTRLSSKELLPARKILIESGIEDSSLKANFKNPVGCPKCNKIGYLGRALLCESLEMNAEIAKALREDAPAEEIRNLAIDAGMTTQAADGYLRAYAGETSLAEITRIV